MRCVGAEVRKGNISFRPRGTNIKRKHFARELLGISPYAVSSFNVIL